MLFCKPPITNYDDRDIYSIFNNIYQMEQTAPAVEDFSSEFSPTVISRMSEIVDEVSTVYDPIRVLRR